MFKMHASQTAIVMLQGNTVTAIDKITKRVTSGKLPDKYQAGYNYFYNRGIVFRKLRVSSGVKY